MDHGISAGDGLAKRLSLVTAGWHLQLRYTRSAGLLAKSWVPDEASIVHGPGLWSPQSEELEYQWLFVSRDLLALILS
jgi:hypothetical protein